MNVLVINYRKMLVGGIENYINEVVSANLEISNRVIWVAEFPISVAPIYNKIFNSKVIDIVPIDIHGINWGRIPNLHVSQEDKIIILSFGFMDHARALEYKKRNPNFNISLIYLIPHFTGASVFPEQYFNNNCLVKKRISKIYEKWIKCNFIHFFAKKHCETISAEYGIIIPEDKQHLVYIFRSKEPFSEDEVRNRYRRQEFKIVGSGRFDFPHKGFFMGLIKVFGEYKKQYKNIVLYLIGEPIGEIDSLSMMNRLIESFPEETKKDIHFIRNMSVEKLEQFYRDCNLSVAVAGCANMSANNGVLTLPARHYDYSCEVYGFFPKSKDRVLDSTPGEPLSKYLDQALTMTEEDYVTICRQSYYSFGSLVINKNYYFDEVENSQSPGISFGDLSYLKVLFFLSKITTKLRLLRNKR